MLFACLILAHAVLDQDSVPVEITIHHMRASKALEMMEQDGHTYLSSQGIEADDSRGVLTVQGGAARVTQVRGLAKLFDVPRKQVSIRVTVESEADKEAYQVSAKIWNMQKWKTGDGDTGITLAVEPRLGLDHTVTMSIVCGRQGASSIEETFRMKLGTSRTLTLGSQISQVYRQKPDGTFSYKATAVPEPKVTIWVDR